MKNTHTLFALLLVLSLPLALGIPYYISQSISSTNNTHSLATTSTNKTILPPSYSITELVIDTDLNKFPSDYNSLLETLNISLSQHQKMTLLLYGETVVKSEHSKVSDAYRELVEKEMPVLIPQEYLNIYINGEVKRYVNNQNRGDNILQEEIVEERNSFPNQYSEYIYTQLHSVLPLLEENTNYSVDGDLDVRDFVLELNSESINQAYQRVRVVKVFTKKIGQLQNFLNNIVAYSQIDNDINTKNRLSKELKHIIYNPILDREGELYWKISVVKDKLYTYPIYITEQFEIDDNNFYSDYDIAPIQQTTGTTRVPILMYHHIEEVPESGSDFAKSLYVTPEIFEQQLAYLVKKNYKSITPKELYNLAKKGENPSQKSIMLTFDDGNSNNYTNAYPLLKKYGFTGIFYIISNKKLISIEHLQEMAVGGMIIDSHSATHADLSRTRSANKLYTEIVGSKHTLEKITGKEIYSIAYPGCVANRNTYRYLPQGGYLIGLSCGKDIDHSPSRLHALSRRHIYNSIESLKDILSGKL